MQVQPSPSTAPIATYAGTLPMAAQTQMTVIPQAQSSVLLPTQQQVPNNQVLYATPSAMPVQGVVPQVVPHDATQYQSGMVAANHGSAPGAPIAGQADLNATVPYGVPGIQPIVSTL